MGLQRSLLQLLGIHGLEKLVGYLHDSEEWPSRKSGLSSCSFLCCITSFYVHLFFSLYFAWIKHIFGWVKVYVSASSVLQALHFAINTSYRKEHNTGVATSRWKQTTTNNSVGAKTGYKETHGWVRAYKRHAAILHLSCYIPKQLSANMQHIIYKAKSGVYNLSSDIFQQQKKTVRRIIVSDSARPWLTRCRRRGSCIDAAGRSTAHSLHAWLANAECWAPGWPHGLLAAVHGCMAWPHTQSLR